MPFPNFDPVLLQIGPIAIRWYALAYVAGILLGWRYAAALVANPRLWAQRGPIATPDQIGDLVLWITLGVILGGRLGHVFFYTPEVIWKDPLGLAIHCLRWSVAIWCDGGRHAAVMRPTRPHHNGANSTPSAQRG